MNKIILNIFLIFLSACSSLHVATLRNALPRTDGCSLELFASDNEVAKKFETLCLVETSTNKGVFSDKTAANAIDRARPALCACGADAGVIMSSSSAKAGFWTATFFTPTQDQSGNAQIKGIRYIKE